MLNKFIVAYHQHYFLKKMLGFDVIKNKNIIDLFFILFLFLLNE